jgi:predicted dehydrogenase
MESTTSQLLRYVIIGGAASIAPNHYSALARLPAQIVGIADINVERGHARATEIGCPFFADHQPMLKALQPDIAVVCTPHPSHASITIDSLQAGCHVLTEKPIAVEVAEADAMIAVAEQTKRIMAVNFQHRFRPVVEKAKQLIDNGEMGALVRVMVVEPWLRTAAYYRSASWRGSWTTEGGGVLLNQSPHTLDLLCYLVGSPSKVWGWIRTRYQAMECEDTAQAMLEYPNGAPGYFTASTAEAGGERRIEIVGERGTLILVGDQLTFQQFDPPLRDFITNDPNFFNTPNIRSETFMLPANDSSGNHFAVHRDLQAAIAENRQPRCNGAGGLLSLELANAIIYSSFSGQAATLPLDRPAYHALLTDLKTHKLP